ncbi:UNVERIFIED_CONTAM: hypothetical protein RKD50_009085 [Streptomyces canus]
MSTQLLHLKCFRPLDKDLTVPERPRGEVGA